MRYLLLLFAFLQYECSSPPEKEHPHDLPIRIINLNNDSKLQTGFILGTSYGDNIDSIQIKLDDGSFQKATGASEWKFKLPTGKDIWKLGSSHRIEARIVYKDGTHSASHVVRVLKDQNLDTNGNGYVDHVEVNRAEDKLYVVYGSKDGVKDKSLKAANKVWKAKDSDKNFGHSVTVADVDGDGYADILVGSNHVEDDSALKAYLYTGSEKHPDNGELLFHKTMTGQTSSSYFGVTFQIGDTNEDGYSTIHLEHQNDKHIIKSSDIINAKKKNFKSK